MTGRSIGAAARIETPPRLPRVDGVEVTERDGEALAYIIRAKLDPPETTFLTPSDLNLQVGLVVRGAGDEIARHDHRPLERRIVGTCEVIAVRRGSCEMEVYARARELVATVALDEGDVVLMTAGGHGFRMLNDTVLLEVKQGPYSGVEEKERF